MFPVSRFIGGTRYRHISFPARFLAHCPWLPKLLSKYDPYHHNSTVTSQTHNSWFRLFPCVWSRKMCSRETEWTKNTQKQSAYGRNLTFGKHPRCKNAT